ncbi:MAG: hypothetical protein OJF52_003296 [Nitrospira sp.]|jgi:hypothetical protein|nr:MAG: hypothetical protein OJF52_003296 [Nitrospira sp.]
MMRLLVCVLATLLFVTAQRVESQATDRLTITMKVTAQGLTVSGIAMQDRRMTIPRGTPVRLVLEYADTNRNAHKFTLTARNTEMTSPAIDGETRKTATIDFTAGDRGQEFYRLSCELPCIAMDQLVDYIIMVGPPRVAA